jgi:hypothetical protein
MAQRRGRFMKRIAILFAFVGCSSTALAAWTAQGPFGSSVVDAFEQQGTVLRIGTLDGVYQSADTAANWSRLGDIPRGVRISSLATQPGNPAVILASSFSTTYRSTDCGVHFTASGQGFAQLLFNPAAPNEVLATDFFGNSLHRSTDAGQSWSTVSFAGDVPIAAFAIAAAPEAHVFYLSTVQGDLYESADDGLHWSFVNNDPLGIPFSFAFDPNDADVMLWSDFSLDAGYVTRFLRSSKTSSVVASADRSGQITADRTTNGRFWYNGVKFGDTLVPYGAIVYESVDHGASFQSVGWFPGYLLAADPVTPNSLYGVDDVGFATSIDGGHTWQTRTHGIPLAATIAASVRPERPDEILAGGHGFGVQRSVDAGNSWQPSTSGLTQLAVNSLVRSPLDPLVVYAGTDDGLFVSSDGGQHWRDVAIAEFPYAGAHSFGRVAVDALDPSRMTAEHARGGLMFSNDGGIHWHSAVTSDAGADLRILPREKTGTHHIYALGSKSGLDYRLYRAATHDAAFFPTAGELAIRAVAVRQDTDSELAAFSLDQATFNWNVYRSHDGGDHWQARGSLAPTGYDPQPQLTFDPCVRRGIHVAVGRTFYSSGDDGLTWAEEPFTIPGDYFSDVDAGCVSGKLVEAVATAYAGVQVRVLEVDPVFTDGFETN